MTTPDVTFSVTLPNFPQERETMGRLQKAYVRGAYRGMQTEKVLIVGRIKERFGRPGELGWVTRRLSRSIGGEVEAQPDRIRLIVGSRGDVPYARIHEYGFKGPEAVQSHQRTIRQVFGRRLRSPMTIAVRAFTRQMNMPARPYVRPSVDEELEVIEANLGRAIQRSISGKKET